MIFEMDCKLVVDAFKAPHLDATDLGAIVQGCTQFISFFCENSHVKSTRRSANMVADNLAKVAIDKASPQVHIGVPSYIESLIFSDMN